jgi:molecular chaperone Hsp33
MTLPDTLQRFVFEHAPVRGEIVHLGATWRAVLERHDYPPALRSLLGELMAAAALLASTLKFSGTMTMQMQGSGPVRLLVVECTSELTLRATAKWDGALFDMPLKELLGAGRFVITIDPLEGKHSYQGIVELEGGTVAQVLEHYMAGSEQLQTRLWLAVDGRQASGLLLQRLPAPESADEDSWNRAVQLASTIARDELLQLSAQQIIQRLYHEEDIRVFRVKPVSFRCSCSRENVTTMLRTLGYGEVRSVLEERGAVEVHCEFCNRFYLFDRVDAEQVFAAEVITRVEPTRH